MKNIIQYAIFFCLLLFFYPQIVNTQPISGGDYITYRNESFSYSKTFAFSAWEPKMNLGWSTIGLMHYDPYMYVMSIGNALLKNTVITEKIFLWIPFLLLAWYASLKLCKTIFPEARYFFVSPLIFLCNTYVFMLIGGGQITGIGFAYAIAPLVLSQYIHYTRTRKQHALLQSAMWCGLIISVQTMFDLRVTYITLTGIGLYTLFCIIHRSIGRLHIACLPIIPCIVFLLHSFWLLPLLLFRHNPIEQFGSSHASVAMLKFFSFATLEQTISLLHPNWPENIFGKVSFMQPEFLILPIMVYGGIFFIHKKATSEKLKQQHGDVLFFALLGLVGAFLAKGAQEPFGNVYIWLFNHVPGFVMFRDPTKWYVLIVLSYTVLLPFTLEQIYLWIKGQHYSFLKHNRFLVAEYGILMVAVIVGIFLLRPAVTRSLSGTFVDRAIPKEYREFSDFIANQCAYFRILWLPQPQRFGYFSEKNPAVNAHELFGIADRKALYAYLQTNAARDTLEDAGIRYIVIPADTLGEIFLRDRVYSQDEYITAVNTVRKIPWLKHVKKIGNIEIFATQQHKSRFWIDTNETLTWTMQSPADYQIEVRNGTMDGLLVFSERFDPYWVALADGEVVRSKPYKNRFNSFLIKKKTNDIRVYYQPQLWVYTGLFVSGASIVCIGLLLFLLNKKQKH